MNSGWRKGFFETVIGKWKVLLSYGPSLEFWAQWKQSGGASGAFAFAWWTVTWDKCVCSAEPRAEITWYYCGYHRKGLHGMNQ